jgi:hypothetical protein
MSKPSQDNFEAAESSIPNWVVYALLAVVSLLIAKTVHGALVTLVASGILAMLALFYLSKPVAEIEPVREKSDKDQLNLFHKKHKIGKKYSNRKPSATEHSGQRKRYLKTLNEEDKRAA